jgi:hypothetical protein
MACYNGRYEVVAALVEDVRVSIDCKGRSGRTPLMYLAAGMIQAFEDHRAEHQSCFETTRWTNIALLLIERGCSLEGLDGTFNYVDDVDVDRTMVYNESLATILRCQLFNLYFEARGPFTGSIRLCAWAVTSSVNARGQ